MGPNTVCTCECASDGAESQWTLSANQTADDMRRSPSAHTRLQPCTALSLSSYSITSSFSLQRISSPLYLLLSHFVYSRSVILSLGGGVGGGVVK